MIAHAVQTPRAVARLPEEGTTETLDEVRGLAREFKEKGIDILGISGGDGTNHRTLSTFLEVYGETPLPKIALLRGGTMNNLANQLGIGLHSYGFTSGVLLLLAGFVVSQLAIIAAGWLLTRPEATVSRGPRAGLAS